MSWWNIRNGEEVIGDEPADLVQAALGRINENRSAQSKEKPTLVELLSAIASVARDSAGKLLAAAPNDFRRIVAELQSGDFVSSETSAQQSAQQETGLRPALTAVLQEIAKVYRERWERLPTLAEWLESLAFVLRARPEEYLQDGSEHPLANLRAE